MNTIRYYLIVSALVWAAAPLCAADVLERRINVRFQQTPIEKAMQMIAEKGQFEWSYNPNIVESNKKINLSAQNWTVRETLHAVFGDGYLFKPNGNYLILKKDKKAGEKLSGYITDPKTGGRLANATVYDRKTLRAVQTDSNGYYEFKKIDKTAELVVAKLGYRDTVLQVASQTPRFQTIRLQTVETLPQMADTAPLRTTRDIEAEINAELRNVAAELERLFAATLDKWHEVNVRDSFTRAYQISLLPTLGTNHILSGKVANKWSANIVAGNSRAVLRLEAAGVGNFTRERVSGIQAAGVFNILRGENRGLQAAGVYNHTGETLKGAQLSGLVNVARRVKRKSVQGAGVFNFAGKGGISIQAAGMVNVADSVRAIQAAGIANVANHRVRGLQAAGITNVAPRLKGVQATGIVNSASEIKGVQAAGIVNYAADLRGIQISGLVNRADTLSGIQIGGIHNSARKVRGVQIGLINTARHVRGLQIGLINRSGRRVLPFFNW